MAEEQPAEPADSPVCFFLGAGASVPAGIPATVGLVNSYRDTLGRKPVLQATFNEVYARLEKWVKSSGGQDAQMDIEVLLAGLTFATQTSVDVAGAFVDPAAQASLSRPEVQSLLDDLRAYLREKCSVDPSSTQYWANFLGHVQTFGRTHVFTVNYDLVIETFLERFGYPYTDGFQESWDRQLFDVKSVQVCLYKLHGSVNWYRTPSGAYLKLPIRNPPPVVSTYSGASAEPLMLYPAQKLVYSGPFLEMTGRLQTQLENSIVAVVAGYSFRDEHLARIFAEALSTNPSLVLMIIGPSSRQIYERRLANIRVDRKERGSLDELTEFSSLKGRVFPIPSTIENANGNPSRSGPSIAHAG